MRRSVWMPAAALVLAALLLFAAYNGLGGLRQEILQRELNDKMRTLLPGSTAFTPEEYAGEDANIRAVYKGETGYVLQTVTAGYAGEITMLIGVSSQGKVTGLQVRKMQETFGLGGEALTNDEFLAQFLNGGGNFAVSTGEDAFSGATGESGAEADTYVDAMTGATVTSKAIVRMVNSAVAFVTGADTDSGATGWGG